MENSRINSHDKQRNEDIRQRLLSSTKAFSDITGVPVTTYGLRGEILTEYNSESKLCSHLSVYSVKNSGCRKLLTFAGEFSSRLGEPYIFLCKAGFSNIAVPVILSGEFKGYAVAGPFIMKKLRGSTMKNLYGMNRIQEDEKAAIGSLIDGMKVFTSQEVTSLSLLFYDCVLSSLVQASDYTILYSKNEEQKTISQKIRNAKNEAILSSVFTKEAEREMVEYILGNDTESASRMIRRILDRFSVVAVGNLDEIKTLSLWATATIVKDLTSEINVRFGDDLDVDIDIINRISEADSLEELNNAFMYIVEYVSSDLVSSIYTGSSLLISHALKYIKDHFKGKLNLKDMCSDLHVNPTYFSYLFSREMGMTFIDYLTDIRLNFARELLNSTNLSILDIAVSSGFENQSYFTKVFKAKLGMTPREFRRNNEKAE